MLICTWAVWYLGVRVWTDFLRVDKRFFGLTGSQWGAAIFGTIAALCLVRWWLQARRGGGKVEIRRIAEHVQMDPDLMAELRAVGILPGRTVSVGPSQGEGHPIEINNEGVTARLAPSVLHAILAIAR